jgi:hypothetical protein
MTPRWSLRARERGAAAFGVAIAGLGTFAIGVHAWWGGSSSVGWNELVLGLVAVGVTAGFVSDRFVSGRFVSDRFVSGRFGGALFSWAAAFIAAMLAYRADTATPAGPGELGFILLVFVGGGHLLGAWVRNAGRRGALVVAVAGLGTCAFLLCGYWNLRANGPSPSGTAELMVGLALWIAIGAAAGLISGRFREASASWAAALIGVLAAYQLFYVILFPGTRYWGEDGFEGDLPLIAPALLLVIAGGHLLGTAAGRLALRRPRVARGP